jgi:hypothetical protein
MSSHNITTHFHANQRVSFACPEGGYSLEDLDTLQAAIKHARRKLREQTASEFLTIDPTEAFAQQLDRMAAPT